MEDLLSVDTDESSNALSPAQAVYFKTRNPEKRRETLAAKAAAWHEAIKVDVIRGVTSNIIGKKHGLTPAQIALLKLLRRDFSPGQTKGPAPDMHVLAELSGISPNTARKWTRIFGFLTSDDIEKIVSARVKAKLSSGIPNIRGTARYMGLNPSRVMNVAKRHDIRGQGPRTKLGLSRRSVTEDATTAADEITESIVISVSELGPSSTATDEIAVVEVVVVPPAVVEPEDNLVPTNFFLSLYGTKPPRGGVRAAHIAFSEVLAEAGIRDPQALRERRARGDLVLPLTNSALKRLRRFVTDLGANHDLEIGLFHAGVRHTETIDDLGPPERTHTFAEAAVNFTYPAPQQGRFDLEPEKPPPPRDFSRVDLNNLLDAEIRAMHHFMRRLMSTDSVNRAVSHCPVGENINSSCLNYVSVSTLLRPMHGQPEKVARRATNELLHLGVFVSDSAGNLSFSQSFALRLNDVVVWYIRQTAEPDQRSGKHGQHRQPAHKACL